MGIPAFFRNLMRKYPKVLVHCIEEKAVVINGVKTPVDITKVNPNGLEFDNLYLDMNAIIHPCCHPENKPAPKNEDEMMEAIFQYIDRLVSIVRPRQLLYMAIDGVAPKAKMNQQRSRRFRAAKDSRESREKINKMKEELRKKGAKLPEESSEHFDSNCITPGTEFMSRLSTNLENYTREKLNSDSGWSNLKVIISDSNVPGEGEHKIMDFIRNEKVQPNYDPNKRHCLCGADADLIMLGLATHEANFTIIREELKPNTMRSCEICGRKGHSMADCTGLVTEEREMNTEEQEFILLRLDILRDYLYNELKIENLQFHQNMERTIDDWVLMCFFIGNDFLPHLPSLEIRENAIDRLVELYKAIIPRIGGYLSNKGYIYLDRVQFLLHELGQIEGQIFRKRRQQEENQKYLEERRKRPRMTNVRDAPAHVPTGSLAPMPIGGYNRPLVSVNIKEERKQFYRSYKRFPTTQGFNNPNNCNSNHNNCNNYNSNYNNYNSNYNNHNNHNNYNYNNNYNCNSNYNNNRKRKSEETEQMEEDGDKVRLWEHGFKERYYSIKFGVAPYDINFRRLVAKEYMMGICWVLKYYYEGCPSWRWCYPFHYAPFASDLATVGNMRIYFPSNTTPLKPLEQLMSVFPTASKSFLPPSWQELMCSEDSEVKHFYPNEFQIDLNGKKNAWQGVALIPFVDENKLLKALEAVYPNLTEEEKQRNSLGRNLILVR